MEAKCPDDHPHGRFRKCYRGHGCRCKNCRISEARRKAQERARIRAGLHEGMVDKRWAVGHIQALELMGMTRRDIGRCSGLNEATIRRVVDGPGEMIFPQTSKAIMAVRPETPTWRAERAWVNSIGTVRRVQALMAIGWTGKQIGARSGHNPEWATRVLRSTTNRIEERSRLAMVEAYAGMSMVVPAGVYAERTRRWAAKQGFVPPLAWDDDMDDPAAVPNTDGEGSDEPAWDVIEEALRGDTTNLTLEERDVAIAELHARYWSAERIGEHLGISGKTVERTRKRLGLSPLLVNATHSVDGTVAA